MLSCPSGLLEPALVAFRSGVADPLHRHHSHSAGGHFPGRASPDGHERLPECAAEHAGQLHTSIPQHCPARLCGAYLNPATQKLVTDIVKIQKQVPVSVLDPVPRR